MKKLILSLVTSGAAMALASAATAAPFITPIVTGSAAFGNNTVDCAGAAPCAFSDTLTFVTPVGYNLTSATISSTIVGVDATTNIDFSSVTLNGVAFTTVFSGATEFRQLLNLFIISGATNTLVISGTTGGNGSYGGALVFSQAVPEPATWALMILGFGAVGYSMRRRSAVRFAQAF